MIDWTKIRPFNASQNNAFEELVCQLARAENIATKVPDSFQKIGNPDGGIEGYCLLENGSMYGWQAKYFFNVGKTQWDQITKSFRTAFQKHPKLAKYYVCLPIDRADPKIPGKQHIMDKWNDKVVEWKKYAAQKGRDIEFEYWGSSELIDRLSKEEHAGRRYFWFGKEEFSNKWFDNLLDTSIQNLGERYTPELNFELEIAKNFDALALNDSYVAEIRSHFDNVLSRFNSDSYLLQDFKFGTQLQSSLKAAFLQCQNDPYKRLNREYIIELCKRLISRLNACERIVVRKCPKGEEEKRNITLRKIRRLQYVLDDFQVFLSSRYLKLAQLPILLLSGDMGSGKSHLLADVAINRAKNSKKSLLLLGQHFTEETPPWKQIIESVLQLKCSKEEFLGALSAQAEISGERIIVFIDAINEGKGKYFWPEHLSGFISDFLHYPWLGLVLSIRTTYQDELAPETIISSEKAIRIHHTGFREVEYEAIKKFFGYYGINQPSTPILNPEFQNPLFLKLFCEGLKRSGLDTIPKGHEGITEIIKFYFSSINKLLAKPSKFNYSNSINLVEKAVSALIKTQFAHPEGYISEEEAHTIIQQVISPYINQPGFLSSLISEGVLTKNSFYLGKGKWAEGIYLAYERFADHFKARFLFEQHVDKANPRKSFKKDSYLHNKLFEKDHWVHQGIIESLSVQLPEELKLELYEVLPKDLKNKEFIASAFVTSLLWRKPETISKKVINYINKAVLPYEKTHDEFFEVVISQAGNPNHFFNAKSLHAHLSKNSLADRDSHWTVYISDKFDRQTAIKRLIEWAWEGHYKAGLAKESLHLSGLALAWLLTSPNRELRDSATKALIALFDNELEALIGLLEAFKEVNDPYVYERLYAVAYGCTLRANVTRGIKNLAEYIYQTIFNVQKVYPHVLLRDYARGVIEYALSKGIKLSIKVDKIRPPYKSDFPKKLPTNKEIETYEFDYKAKDFKDHYWSQNEIIRSMVTEYGRGIGGYGDFGRYTFQSGFSDWDSLNPQDLSNLAVKRIMQMGYDVEKHGRFDRDNSSHSRNPSRIERIGKKYQWIAFHEIMARVADNFKMQDPAAWKAEKLVYFQGPWESSVRDIDPSVIIRKTNHSSSKRNSPWKTESYYSDWNGSLGDWLSSVEHLPDPKDLIDIKDPQDGEWLALSIHPQWKEPLDIGATEHKNSQRQLWYNIHSYLVETEKLKELIKYAWKQDYLGILAHHTEVERDLYKVFSREFYWSPAYQHFSVPYYYGQEWHEIEHKGKVVARCLPTTERYLWESGQDYSTIDGLVFRRPHRFLYSGMKMNFSEEEAEFSGSSSTVACFDPCVKHDSISSLLIHKASIQKFLKEKKLSILWTVLGEKSNLGTYSRGIEILGIYSLSPEGKLSGQMKTREPKN